MKPVLARLAACALAAAALAAPAAAATFNLNAVDHGWFQNTGRHGETNLNIYTGAGDTFRSFHRFAISGVGGGSVTSATLTFRGGNGTFRGSGPETVVLSDVTSNAALFSRSYGGGDPTGIGLFDDLGTGTYYGHARISAPNGAPMPTFSIALNGAALDDLNAAISAGAGSFLVGVRSPTLLGTQALWSSSSLRPASFLRIETTPDMTPVPLPAGAVLLLSGLAALGLARRRMKAGRGA